MEPSDIEVKGPQDILLDLPQERLTSITRGRGPRRGNLERLLRYWRPIMKKPGGFTQCRVILANHPELYPLERICAWLHHESQTPTKRLVCATSATATQRSVTSTSPASSSHSDGVWSVTAGSPQRKHSAGTPKTLATPRRSRRSYARILCRNRGHLLPMCRD